jgi:hypothetical protein
VSWLSRQKKQKKFPEVYVNVVGVYFVALSFTTLFDISRNQGVSEFEYEI